MADKTIKTLPTKNTTLLDLLRMGARIEFRSGRAMHGRPSPGYIDISNECGSLGLWDLDAENGVADAVADLTRDAAENGLTLHGDAIPQDEDDGDRGQDHGDED